MHALVQVVLSHTRPIPLPRQRIAHCWRRWVEQNEGPQPLVTRPGSETGADAEACGSSAGETDGSCSRNGRPGGTLPQMHALVQVELSQTRPIPLPRHRIAHCCRCWV